MAAKKREFYKATFSGHLYPDLFLTELRSSPSPYRIANDVAVKSIQYKIELQLV